jgi:hypothetical protein
MPRAGTEKRAERSEPVRPLADFPCPGYLSGLLLLHQRKRKSKKQTKRTSPFLIVQAAEESIPTKESKIFHHASKEITGSKAPAEKCPIIIRIE